jgi:hypothetical protein
VGFGAAGHDDIHEGGVGGPFVVASEEAQGAAPESQVIMFGYTSFELLGYALNLVKAVRLDIRARMKDEG